MLSFGSQTRCVLQTGEDIRKAKRNKETKVRIERVLYNYNKPVMGINMR